MHNIQLYSYCIFDALSYAALSLCAAPSKRCCYASYATSTRASYATSLWMSGAEVRLSLSLFACALRLLPLTRTLLIMSASRASCGSRTHFHVHCSQSCWFSSLFLHRFGLCSLLLLLPRLNSIFVNCLRVVVSSFRFCLNCPVVLKLWYSCLLWHFDQNIVTLCLNFYVTLLTPRCKENDTQADTGTDFDFCFQTIGVHWAINKLCGISHKVKKRENMSRKYHKIYI